MVISNFYCSCSPRKHLIFFFFSSYFSIHSILSDDWTKIWKACFHLVFFWWISLFLLNWIIYSQVQTINDVITGISFFGTRLYMQEISQKSSKADSTAIVFFSTRTVRGFKSVKEMIKPESDTPWGNQFGLLHVSIPKFTNLKSSNPLEFVLKVHKIIKKKRNS